MIYNLIFVDNALHVENLRDEWCDTPHTLLIVRYDAGDCDTISKPIQSNKLHRALYDLYQTSDTLKDGDCFAIDGVVTYKCEGIHVVRCLFEPKENRTW